MSTKLLAVAAATVAAVTAINVFQPQTTPTDTIIDSAAPAVISELSPAQARTPAVSSEVISSQQYQLPAPASELAAQATKTVQSELCQQNDEAKCTLRSDIDISHAFAASPTQLDGKKVLLALGSNNFDQLHQLLAKSNTNQEALLRQADYQAAFNEFYQYAPGLLSNNVTCSDEICAASFTVADANSAQQISIAMDKFTQHINAHSFSTQGRDSADNLEVKLIFSNSAAFETVMH
jgi:hypothetical protein